jgi:hypothetical protein
MGRPRLPDDYFGPETCARPPVRIYREPFLAARGPGPWPCCFCGEPVSKIGRLRGEGHVHHIDEDVWNNNLSNLDIAHGECHKKHHLWIHGPRVPMSKEEARRSREEKSRIRWADPEQRRRAADLTRARFKDPAYREKHMEGVKKMVLTNRETRKTRATRKLIESEVMDLRREHLAGARNKDLAEKYDISGVMVQNIVYGDAWDYLPVLEARAHSRGGDPRKMRPRKLKVYQWKPGNIVP